RGVEVGDSFFLHGKVSFRVHFSHFWSDGTTRQRVNCDPWAYVVSANIHRRHLTAKQRRELIAALLKANPERSNRQTATLTKADHKTVGGVRRELEGTGEIPQLNKTTGQDGKARPTWHGPITNRVNVEALNREYEARKQEERLMRELGDELVAVGYKALAT